MANDGTPKDLDIRITQLEDAIKKLSGGVSPENIPTICTVCHPICHPICHPVCHPCYPCYPCHPCYPPCHPCYPCHPCICLPCQPACGPCIQTPVAPPESPKVAGEG